jgi:hypothetical protein
MPDFGALIDLVAATVTRTVVAVVRDDASLER